MRTRHTLQDTIDKGDKDLLPLPMLVNMISVLRICNADILPYNYVPTAEDYIETLTELHEASKDTVDLSNVLDKAEILKIKAKHIYKILKNSTINENTKNLVNWRLMKVSRILQPAYCTEADRFSQDLAIRILPLPKLQPIKELAEMDQTSDEARFLKTGLIREINKIYHALSEAIEIIEEIQSLTQQSM